MFFTVYWDQGVMRDSSDKPALITSAPTIKLNIFHLALSTKRVILGVICREELYKTRHKPYTIQYQHLPSLLGVGVIVYIFSGLGVPQMGVKGFINLLFLCYFGSYIYLSI